MQNPRGWGYPSHPSSSLILSHSSQRASTHVPSFQPLAHSLPARRRQAQNNRGVPYQPAQLLLLFLRGPLKAPTGRALAFRSGLSVLPERFGVPSPSSPIPATNRLFLPLQRTQWEHFFLVRPYFYFQGLFCTSCPIVPPPFPGYTSPSLRGGLS